MQFGWPVHKLLALGAVLGYYAAEMGNLAVVGRLDRMEESTRDGPDIKLSSEIHDEIKMGN